MKADAIVPAGSSAVLIGVSAYEYAGLPPIRAARNSLNAMHSLLADPALCAWPDGQVTVIANPISAGDLTAQIADLAAATTGVLLLFYVGHGVLSASGDLCLTVTSTHPDRPERSGLPWNTVADVLRGSAAHTRLSILDCCFAGQATGGPAGDGEPDVAPAGLTDIEGGYTLAATTHDDSAHVPHPEQQDDACTSFTGELRDLITHGIPGRPPWLTFGDIYPALCERLTARGLPAPSQRGTGTAREFVFTANAAVPGRPLQRPVAAGSLGARAVATPNPAPAAPSRAEPERPEPGRSQPGPAAPSGVEPERPAPGRSQPGRSQPGRSEPGRAEPGRAEPERGEPGQPGPSRHDHLVTEALRAAQSIPEGDPKARALVAVARAVALTDPDRAARLVADAHRVAQAISDPGEQASALASIAGPLAVSDAGSAETVAQSIPDVPWKATALAGVAGTLAATDAERAARLIADAERAAQSVTDTDRKATALAAVTEALAVIDSDRGEQVAQAIAAAERKAPALAALAQAVTGGDPDRAERLIADAERIARPIPGASARAPALAAVATALAAFDADRAARLVGDAERSAQSIPGMDRKASALAAVAAAMAAVDPAHAERLARSISAASWRATALAAVAAKYFMLPPVQAS
jgi:Caspase domain